MNRCLQMIASEKTVDLEAWETLLRSRVLAAGAQLIEKLLNGIASGRRPSPILCTCGHRMESRGVRQKTVHTLLGPIALRRSLFVCPHCGASRFPADELLDVQETGVSPGLRRMMVRAGSRTSFAEAEEDLRVYANLNVGRKEIERVTKGVGAQIEQWMGQRDLQRPPSGSPQPAPNENPADPSVLYIAFDGTGVPVRRNELNGRKGKQPDGSAKTREAKLGCVFTQTTRDEQGRPIRDPASTTYVGAIENSDSFGWRLFAEARHRGLFSAHLTVVLSDGARYNKSIAQLHFPHAIHIIDLYHAFERLHLLSALLLPEENRTLQHKHWRRLLERGDIKRLVNAIRTCLPRTGKRRKEALAHIQYFLDNAEHMRYAEFRKRGLFVGSGVIEAGCRTMIGERLKKSGMFWSVAGANAVLASRCCLYSGRFEQFWEDRAA